MSEGRRPVPVTLAVSVVAVPLASNVEVNDIVVVIVIGAVDRPEATPTRPGLKEGGELGSRGPYSDARVLEVGEGENEVDAIDAAGCGVYYRVRRDTMSWWWCW